MKAAVRLLSLKHFFIFIVMAAVSTRLTCGASCAAPETPVGAIPDALKCTVIEEVQIPASECPEGTTLACNSAHCNACCIDNNTGAAKVCFYDERIGSGENSCIQRTGTVPSRLCELTGGISGKIQEIAPYQEATDPYFAGPPDAEKDKVRIPLSTIRTKLESIIFSRNPSWTTDIRRSKLQNILEYVGFVSNLQGDARDAESIGNLLQYVITTIDMVSSRDDEAYLDAYLNIKAVQDQLKTLVDLAAGLTGQLASHVQSLFAQATNSAALITQDLQVIPGWSVEVRGIIKDIHDLVFQIACPPDGDCSTASGVQSAAEQQLLDLSGKAENIVRTFDLYFNSEAYKNVNTFLKNKIIQEIERIAPPAQNTQVPSLEERSLRERIILKLTNNVTLWSKTEFIALYLKVSILASPATTSATPPDSRLLLRTILAFVEELEINRDSSQIIADAIVQKADAIKNVSLDDINTGYFNAIKDTVGQLKRAALLMGNSVEINTHLENVNNSAQILLDQITSTSDATIKASLARQYLELILTELKRGAPATAAGAMGALSAMSALPSLATAFGSIIKLFPSKEACDALAAQQKTLGQVPLKDAEQCSLYTTTVQPKIESLQSQVSRLGSILSSIAGAATTIQTIFGTQQGQVGTEQGATSRVIDTINCAIKKFTGIVDSACEGK